MTNDESGARAITERLRTALAEGDLVDPVDVVRGQVLQTELQGGYVLGAPLRAGHSVGASLAKAAAQLRAAD